MGNFHGRKGYFSERGVRMIEKVNPSHPDKLADRIAGAVVDIAYQQQKDPKVAVEVLIGHKFCNMIIESSVDFNKPELKEKIYKAIDRIVGKGVISDVVINSYKQDEHLSNNQSQGFRCGDNGIFKGMPLTFEQQRASHIAAHIYEKYPHDGKYIVDDDAKKVIICQSNADDYELNDFIKHNIARKNEKIIINPLGPWTGGPDVDSGATNRKLGSDMADSVTGGGLHGKDLSKADVSVNIYAFLKAQETKKKVELCCAIGDDTIDGKPYSEIVEIARNYIIQRGGFEKFAEWGLY